MNQFLERILSVYLTLSFLSSSSEIPTIIFSFSISFYRKFITVQSLFYDFQLIIRFIILRSIQLTMLLICRQSLFQTASYALLIFRIQPMGLRALSSSVLTCYCFFMLSYSQLIYFQRFYWAISCMFFSSGSQGSMFLVVLTICSLRTTNSFQSFQIWSLRELTLRKISSFSWSICVLVQMSSETSTPSQLLIFSKMIEEFSNSLRLWILVCLFSFRFYSYFSMIYSFFSAGYRSIRLFKLNGYSLCLVNVISLPLLAFSSSFLKQLKAISFSYLIWTCQMISFLNYYSCHLISFQRFLKIPEQITRSDLAALTSSFSPLIIAIDSLSFSISCSMSFSILYFLFWKYWRLQVSLLLLSTNWDSFFF